jgi:hypothetical protein
MTIIDNKEYLRQNNQIICRKSTSDESELPMMYGRYEEPQPNAATH